MTKIIRVHRPFLECTEPVIFVRIYRYLSKSESTESLDKLEMLLNIDYEILHDYIRQGRVCHGEGTGCQGRCLGRLGLWESGQWVTLVSHHEGLLLEDWKPSMFKILYQRIPHFKAICQILSRGGCAKRVRGLYQFEVPRRRFKPPLTLDCQEMYKEIYNKMTNWYVGAEISSIYHREKIIKLLVEWLRGFNLLENMPVRAGFKFNLREYHLYRKVKEL